MAKACVKGFAGAVLFCMRGVRQGSHGMVI
jgi:hypothetical protein